MILFLVSPHQIPISYLVASTELNNLLPCSQVPKREQIPYITYYKVMMMNQHHLLQTYVDSSSVNPLLMLIHHIPWVYSYSYLPTQLFKYSGTSLQWNSKYPNSILGLYKYPFPLRFSICMGHSTPISIQLSKSTPLNILLMTYPYLHATFLLLLSFS